MDSSIIVACLSLLGTVIGTLGGILVANKLTTYRLSELEKKVEKHNNVVERTYVLEGQVKELQHEVIDLKHKEVQV